MILDIEQARDILRVDGTDNDVVIIPLLEAIPHYLEQTTGHRWNDKPTDELAKATAGFILQLWYKPQGANIGQLRRTIDSLIVALSVKGRSLNGERL